MAVFDYISLSLQLTRACDSWKNGCKIFSSLEFGTSGISTDKYGKSGEKQILNQRKDENLIIYGFKKSSIKTFLTYMLYISTLGILRLVFHWYPTWRLYATHSKCNLKIAEKVLVVDKYQGKFKSYFVEEVKLLSASSISSQNNFNGAPQRDCAENNESKLNIYMGDGYLTESNELRAVWCKRLCYIWDDDSKRFVKLVGLDKGRKCFEYHEFKGFSAKEESLRLITYDKNEIDIPVNTILTLLVLEALTPFYIFQVFSLIVWFAEAYYYYTIAIVIMSVFGVTSSIIQTRRNQRSLRETVHSAETAIVRRGSEEYEEIPSCNLVPGDVIEIPKNGCTMQCDAVLLNGNCIVNESMLTGESVPITKTPIPKTNASYDIKEDSFHTLFCGTNVIQTRSQDLHLWYIEGNDRILAVVIRTGFLTSKGELVRSILYPPPSDFKFDRDSYKFIGILTAVALLGCIYTVVSKSGRAIAAGDIIIKALDLITIVIPPALPAAMTMGKLYALGRLKKHDIFCMNSRVINVSGSIDCVCFDKTGTLTEDGLDMWGVVPKDNDKLKESIKEIAVLPKTSRLLKGMATCHSLTVIDGKLLGDPLDAKVFESTGWLLEEFAETDTSGARLYRITKPPRSPRRRVDSLTIESSNNLGDNDKYQIEILRQYQFSSSLQRMSVITKSSDSNLLEIFCKGSPEMIISLAKPESIPVNMQNRLKEFTEKGYRVIALGTKTIESISLENVQKLERASVESDLEFAGLVILENRTKPETPAVIRVLKEARIKTVMITGDNIQTALSVARECGIIDSGETVITVSRQEEKPTTLSLATNKISYTVNGERSAQNWLYNKTSLEDGSPRYCYAMTGTTWTFVKEHFPDHLPELVANGTVFARMSGQQKQQLVQELQQLGFYVAMCGDGANDCGALKAAHVGISLSEEESSVASPFTSKNPDISCVPKVIKEGRAALITSIGIFKFMICYSLTQFTSAIVLYGIDSNLTSLQFLFIDICLIIHFTSFFGKTEAYKGPLNKNRPPTSLLSTVSISSILFQISFVIIFQVAAYKIVQTYDWFEPFVYDPNMPTYYTCYENYAVYCVSMFQYITMAVAFSKGKPYRQPVYTNTILLLSFMVMEIVCVYITLYPARWIITALELKMPPSVEMGLVILALAAANFACSLLAEDVIVEYFLNRKIVPKLRSMLPLRNKCPESVENLRSNLKISMRSDEKKPAYFVHDERSWRKESKTQDGQVNFAFQDENIHSQFTKL